MLMKPPGRPITAAAAAAGEKKRERERSRKRETSRMKKEIEKKEKTKPSSYFLTLQLPLTQPPNSRNRVSCQSFCIRVVASLPSTTSCHTRSVLISLSRLLVRCQYTTGIRFNSCVLRSLLLDEIHSRSLI